MVLSSLRFVCTLTLAGVLMPEMAAAACSSTCRPDGKQTSGAIYRICMPEPPSCRNGDLVIYAHGYVDAFKPVGIPEDQLMLPDGTSVPALVNSLGYAFATTSYSRNGLAVLEGIQDVRDLVDVYTNVIGTPRRTFVAGPSEGGIVTAKTLETYPQVFSGGLAACGPVGNFRAQINYMGDFRVIFNYLFPGVLPGKATDIPQSVIDNWDAVYKPAVKAAVAANPTAAAELIRVARVPTGQNPANNEDAIVSLAWYSVFATNDATTQLGGQPYDNIGKWYTGSSNDLRLNLMVERYAAAPNAVLSLQKYETSGLLTKPLVTMHTTGDQIVPYWHEPLYRTKVDNAGTAAMHTNVPISRYDHCNFTANEVLFGFALMVLKATGQQQPGLSPVPPSVIDTRAASAQ